MTTQEIPSISPPHAQSFSTVGSAIKNTEANTPNAVVVFPVQINNFNIQLFNVSSTSSPDLKDRNMQPLTPRQVQATSSSSESVASSSQATSAPNRVISQSVDDIFKESDEHFDLEESSQEEVSQEEVSQEEEEISSDEEEFFSDEEDEASAVPAAQSSSQNAQPTGGYVDSLAAGANFCASKLGQAALYVLKGVAKRGAVEAISTINTFTSKKNEYSSHPSKVRSDLFKMTGSKHFTEFLLGLSSLIGKSLQEKVKKIPDVNDLVNMRSGTDFLRRKKPTLSIEEAVNNTILVFGRNLLQYVESHRGFDRHNNNLVLDLFSIISKISNDEVPNFDERLQACLKISPNLPKELRIANVKAIVSPVLKKILEISFPNQYEDIAAPYPLNLLLWEFLREVLLERTAPLDNPPGWIFSFGINKAVKAICTSDRIASFWDDGLHLYQDFKEPLLESVRVREKITNSPGGDRLIRFGKDLTLRLLPTVVPKLIAKSSESISKSLSDGLSTVPEKKHFVAIWLNNLINKFGKSEQTEHRDLWNFAGRYVESFLFYIFDQLASLPEKGIPSQDLATKVLNNFITIVIESFENKNERLGQKCQEIKDLEERIANLTNNELKVAKDDLEKLRKELDEDFAVITEEILNRIGLAPTGIERLLSEIKELEIELNKPKLGDEIDIEWKKQVEKCLEDKKAELNDLLSHHSAFQTTLQTQLRPLLRSLMPSLLIKLYANGHLSDLVPQSNLSAEEIEQVERIQGYTETKEILGIVANTMVPALYGNVVKSEKKEIIEHLVNFINGLQTSVGVNLYTREQVENLLQHIEEAKDPLIKKCCHILEKAIENRALPIIQHAALSGYENNCVSTILGKIILQGIRIVSSHIEQNKNDIKIEINKYDIYDRESRAMDVALRYIDVNRVKILSEVREHKRDPNKLKEIIDKHFIKMFINEKLQVLIFGSFLQNISQRGPEIAIGNLENYLALKSSERKESMNVSLQRAFGDMTQQLLEMTGLDKDNAWGVPRQLADLSEFREILLPKILFQIYREMNSPQEAAAEMSERLERLIPEGTEFLQDSLSVFARDIRDSIHSYAKFNYKEMAKALSSNLQGSKRISDNGVELLSSTIREIAHSPDRGVEDTFHFVEEAMRVGLLKLLVNIGDGLNEDATTIRQFLGKLNNKEVLSEDDLDIIKITLAKIDLDLLSKNEGSKSVKRLLAKINVNQQPSKDELEDLIQTLTKINAKQLPSKILKRILNILATDEKITLANLKILKAMPNNTEEEKLAVKKKTQEIFGTAAEKLMNLSGINPFVDFPLPMSAQDSLFNALKMDVLPAFLSKLFVDSSQILQEKEINEKKLKKIFGNTHATEAVNVISYFSFEAARQFLGLESKDIAETLFGVIKEYFAGNESDAAQSALQFLVTNQGPVQNFISNNIQNFALDKQKEIHWMGAIGKEHIHSLLLKAFVNLFGKISQVEKGKSEFLQNTTLELLQVITDFCHKVSQVRDSKKANDAASIDPLQMLDGFHNINNKKANEFLESLEVIERLEWELNHEQAADTRAIRKQLKAEKKKAIQKYKEMSMVPAFEALLQHYGIIDENNIPKLSEAKEVWKRVAEVNREKQNEYLKAKAEFANAKKAFAKSKSSASHKAKLKDAKEKLSKIRKELYFRPLAEPILQLFGMNNKDDLPPEIQEKLWKAAVDEIIPSALDSIFTALTDPRTLENIMLNSSKAMNQALEALKMQSKGKPAEVTPADEIPDDEEQKEWNKRSGAAVIALVDLVPSWIRLLLHIDGVKNMAAEMIGKEMRAAIGKWTLLKIIDKGFEEGIPSITPGKWEVRDQSASFVPKVVDENGKMTNETAEFFDFNIPLDPVKAAELNKEKEELAKNRTKDLQTNLTAVLSDGLKAAIRESIKGKWNSFQTSLTGYAESIGGKRCKDVKEFLDDICHKLFFDILGTALAILTWPLYKIIWLIIDTYLGRKADQIRNSVLMEINEKLIFDMVKLVLESLLHEKTNTSVQAA